MIPRDVKSPTVAVPFHRLLKLVAVVDRNDRVDGRIKFHTYVVRE